MASLVLLPASARARIVDTYLAPAQSDIDPFLTQRQRSPAKAFHLGLG